MSTLSVTNLKHESASGNNITLASDGTAAFAEIITASKGLKFPGTAVASADPNTLDDYEEGTWTPGLSFGGSSSGVTYTRQDGSYTKIGNFVCCHIHIDLSNNGSGTGTALLTGLPFTVGNYLPNTSLEGSGFTSYFNNAGVNCSGFTFSAINGGTTAEIQVLPASGLGIASATDANITNSWNIRAMLIYPAV